MNQTKQLAADVNFAADDEIDLRELFATIWAGKWLITAITSVFAIGAVCLALYLPNIYKSEALLAPASQEQGGLGGLAGQFGGLASLAGISLGGGGAVDNTTLAMEVVQSRTFLSNFIEQHQLQVALMAAKGWDESTDQLLIDEEVYNGSSKQWLREPEGRRGVEPTEQELVEAMLELITVSQAKDSGLVSISVEHFSPFVAKQWVDWLVQDINFEMKTRDLKEANKSITYLESKLATTKIAELQNVLYQLIEEQSKTVMFAEVRDEYIFKTVDAAVVPELKAKPKRALICVLGTLLGGMLGVFVVLIRAFVRK
ncbi:Wzz/FepE/Etk N-terminal domain-containing protein [uncultured Ferrimonas sp.]|uniref:Wzz/FepE/Etk N-terminal domain-containing protein n=1 Tax=uncultured Ferrimonas sp. TaxID=432640 RepID=UPI002609DBA6|nr:Wzz/FepE/Etk N-terminal domain-containing protein [uncultured Ferrimonas sp.]